MPATMRACTSASPARLAGIVTAAVRTPPSPVSRPCAPAYRTWVSTTSWTEPSFSASLPKFLYSIKDIKDRNGNFAPDGRFMVILQGEGERTTKIDLVVNFLDELRAKMAPGG